MFNSYSNRPDFENKRSEIQTLFADDGMMLFSAVGKFVSVKYYPTYNADSFAAGRKYDTNNPVMMMFSIEDFSGLVSSVRREAESAILEGKNAKLKKPVSYTIANTSDNGIKIEYRPDGDGVLSAFITIIKGIDRDTFEPSDTGISKTLKVPKQKIKNSDGDVIEFDNIFLLFLKKFENLGLSMGTVSHSVSYGNAKDDYFKSRGGDSGNNYGGNYGNNYGGNYGSPFSNNNYNSGATMQRVATNPSSENDDLPF